MSGETIINHQPLEEQTVKAVSLTGNIPLFLLSDLLSLYNSFLSTL